MGVFCNLVLNLSSTPTYLGRSPFGWALSHEWAGGVDKISGYTWQ